MSKEIKDLLEKIEWGELVGVNRACYICHGIKPTHYCHCALYQALTLLKQPKCKTCGDTGKIIKQDPDVLPVNWEKPCPDCQQPTAGEFTKKLRGFIKLYEKEVPRRAEITFLEEACDIIDRAEAINKALLEACEILTGFLETEHLAEILEKKSDGCAKSCATCFLINEGRAAITRAKKGIKRNGHREQREAEFRVGEGI